MFQTNIIELEFLRNLNVGIRNVDRSWPILTNVFGHRDCIYQSDSIMVDN